MPLIYRVHDEPSMEKVSALREFLATLDIPFAKGGALQAGSIQPHSGARERPRRRATRQRGGAAHAGAGRICRGELRTFRIELAPLRAFHLADPPLRRSDRASRTDPRAQARPDGLPEGTDQKALAEIARADLRHRAPRHAGRARDQRPPDRAFPCRPHRRDFRGPHLRRHPRRPVRETATRPAPTASSRRAPSATNISAIDESAPRHDRPRSRRDLPARRPGHRSSWSKRRRLPARCASRFSSEGRSERRERACAPRARREHYRTRGKQRRKAR